MKKIFIFQLLIVFLLGFAGVNSEASIKQVDYESLLGSGLITFDDIPGGSGVGTNHDGLLEFDIAAFGEHFAGQTLTANGNFDELSGSPAGPITLVAGAANQNLNVHSNTSNSITSQVIAGVGPQGYPNAVGIGEGSLAVLFNYDQFEFGFRLVGTNSGDAFLSFFRRDGSLIESIVLSNLSDSFYGFQKEDGIADIAGISIYNNDIGGIGLDDFKDLVPVPEPSIMLLLSAGLIGLIGLRKEFKK